MDAGRNDDDGRTTPPLTACSSMSSSASSGLDCVMSHLMTLDSDEDDVNNVIDEDDAMSDVDVKVESPSAFIEIAPDPLARRRRSAATEDRRFSCTECPSAFVQLVHLKIHMRRHSGERPFPCPHCDKTFVQKGNLTTHLRKHTGAKPFQCEFPGCGKQFSQLGNLRTHEKLHTDIKRFSCTLCSRAFSQLGNLKSHIAKVHASGAAPTAPPSFGAANHGRSFTSDQVPSSPLMFSYNTYMQPAPPPPPLLYVNSQPLAYYSQSAPPMLMSPFSSGAFIAQRQMQMQMANAPQPAQSVTQFVIRRDSGISPEDAEAALMLSKFASSFSSMGSAPELTLPDEREVVRGFVAAVARRE